MKRMHLFLLIYFMIHSQFLMGNDLLVPKNYSQQYSSKMNVKGEMHFSEDKTKLLVMNWEVQPNSLCNARYDTLSVIDLKSGKTSAEFRFFNSRMRLFLERFDNVLEVDRSGVSNLPYNCFFRFRATSFYEIPKNTLEAKINTFASGNFIVGIQEEPRFVIFDKNLSYIIGDYNLSNKINEPAQETQVLSNGKVIFYTLSKKEKMIKLSIYLFDPLTNDAKIIFPRLEKQSDKKIKIKIGNRFFNISSAGTDEIEKSYFKKTLSVSHFHVQNNQISFKINEKEEYTLDLDGNILSGVGSDDLTFKEARPSLLSRLWQNLIFNWL